MMAAHFHFRRFCRGNNKTHFELPLTMTEAKTKDAGHVEEKGARGETTMFQPALLTRARLFLILGDG